MPFDGRCYKDVHAINNSEAYAERYLKTTTGTSFGDSGGPLFFGQTLVGETVWGESMRCTSPAYEYRLDCPEARSSSTRTWKKTVSSPRPRPRVA